MIKHLCSVLILSGLSMTFAYANEITLDSAYLSCAKKVAENPQEGRAFALRWISDGGGEPAQYCAAKADIAMNFPRIAANRLDKLALRNKLADPYLSAWLYTQSADAWIRGNETDKALEALSNARSMAPSSDEIRLLCAPIYAETGRWGLVKRMLDEAERDIALTSDALVLRARSKLSLSDPAGAAEDVQHALNLEPQNIDGLVLRGELIGLGYAIDMVAPTQ